ncbi:MAG: hypothetical protein ABI591_04415 [Kofleriaceae bacterium]
MTSLDELRAIHSQRIADERATFEAERVAVVEHRCRAEAAAAATLEATLREERDAQLRIEEARVAAEREARMRLEATDAAERARHAAELDARRQAEELELRREEVAKQRPRWMIAVTTIAVAAGITLGYFAVQSSRDADAAAQQRVVAEQEKAQARKAAQAAQDHLAMIEDHLDTVHAKLEHAAAVLSTADKAADQSRAKRASEAAQAEDAAQRKRLADWNAQKLIDERHKGLHMDHCVDTSTGCVKR